MYERNNRVNIPVRLAPDRLAPDRFAPDRSWLLRSLPLKSTLERFTFAPRTLGRVAPAVTSRTDRRLTYLRFYE